MPNVQINSTQPTPIWNYVAKDASMQLLLVNIDLVANVYVGDPSVAEGDNNSYQIQPMSSLSIPANQGWYAINDSDNTPPADATTLQVIPNGNNWSLSPSQFTSLFDLNSLAISIALAIAQTGISFLAAPIPLYQSPPIGNTGLLCAVGSNVSSATYNSPGTGPGNIAEWITITGKPLDVRRVELSNLTPNINNTFGNDANAGRLVVVSFNPTASASATPTQQMIQDGVTLGGTLAAMVAAGVNARVVLYHEPTSSNPPLTVNEYQNSVSYYAPIVQQYYPLDFGFLCSPQKGPLAPSYFINGLFDGVMADFYCSALNQGFDATTMANIAAGNTVNGVSTPLPLGFGECGWNPNKDTTAQINAYIANVNALFASRTGLNSYMCWFNPPNWPPTDTTDIGSTIYSGGPQIAGYQSLFNANDTVSSGSNSSLPAGTAVTLTPLNPSAIGGLAACNQLSYDFACDLIAGSGSTKPFIRATFTFYDFDASGNNLIPVDEVKATIPMGTSPNAAKTIAVGPMSGAFMSLQLRNLDTVNANLVRCQLVGSGRQRAVHDWKWDSLVTPQAIPTYNLPTAGVSYGATLGAINSVTITPGNSTSALFSMFSGQVYIRLNASSTGGSLGSGTIHFTLQVQPSSEWGSGNLFSAYLPNASGGAPVAGEFEDIIALPRGPCLLTITNNDVINASVSAEIIAIER